MNDRIKQIQQALGMSQKDFAEAIGIAPGALSNIYSNRTNATSNHVKGIHKAFPDINVNWLMFGEGEMVNTPSQDSESQNKLQAQDGVAAPSGQTQGLSSGMSSGMPGSLFDVPAADNDGGDVLPFQAQMRSAATQQPARQHLSGSRARANDTVVNAVVMDYKNVDKPRYVKEIRVFFSDGTYETFVPGK